MDQMSTIVMKPEHKEQKPPSWRAKSPSGFMTLPAALLWSSPQ
jgi:hypothetical protein